MNKESLTSALASALQSLNTFEDRHIPMLMSDAADRANGVDPRLISLADALRELKELRLFDDTMLFMADQFIRVTRTDIGTWLLVEGLANSPTEAVDLLERFLSSEEIPFRATVALGGIMLHQSIDVGMGIELIPWKDLPASQHKQSVEEHYAGQLPPHHSAAALIKTVRFPRLHLTDDERKTYKLTPYPYEELYDAHLCMTLAGLQAPEIVAQWLNPPQWIPLRAASMSIPGTTQHTVFPKAYPEEALAKFPRIVKAFSKLDADRKIKLRLPMNRLARAIRRRNHVDAAIDLGIALESLFLEDVDPGEFSFRLKLRAARYLRNTAEERDTVFRLVGDLYTTRSLAVHTGKIPSKTIPKPGKLLKEGYSLVAEAIERIIEEGKPDWKEVILG